ncbi:LCP family protein [Corynebacterium sp. CCUG 69979]|uniref:LCP family protein n=1 Tax=Corynebacterium sp. CCUG 69979 TaxID=2823890 RepID=UPI00210ADA41|nr:LCP family protein [Corynebacterium sp. CCUG 69979]
MSEHLRPVRDIQAAPSRARDISQAGHPAVKGLLATLSVVLLVIAGMGYYSIGRLGNSLSASDLDLGGEDLNGADGAVDILLVGSDSRTDAQGNPLSDEELARLNAGEAEGELNTDTIMVVRVPNDGSRATAVSIPRDTYVHDDTFGNTKINGVYGLHALDKREELTADGMDEGKPMEEQVARAGQQGLINAVADLTGVEVDHYAEVGLLGFVLLTDAVGGVDVCLNAAVDEPLSGARFPAGRSTLNGTQALAFVRQRHDLPRGDLDRIVRQQVFMASLVNKAISAGTLSNPAKLRELSTAVERSVTVDTGWNIMSMATQMSDLAAGNVHFVTIPVTSVNGVGDYGESIVTVDTGQVHNFMDELAREEGVTEPGADDPGAGAGAGAAESDKDASGGAAAALPDTVQNYTATVLNAGEITGQASGVGAYLSEQGMTVESVSNASPGLYFESQILAANPSDPAAVKLAEALGGLPIVAHETVEAGSVVVVIHDDYTGPTSDSAAAAPTEVSQEETVGTPGEDFGAAEVAPEFNAGGTGPRCVN